jgi:uncharacterized Zn finger protein
VDVESAELKAMPEWIESGIIDQVSQIGIEIHTDVFKTNNIVEELGNLVDLMRNLYKANFRLISTSNNECIAKEHDMEKRYFNLMEVVFYKED